MSMQQLVRVAAFAALCVGWGSLGWAQQVNVQAPYRVVSDGFYEHFGIRWGFQGRGFFFNNGGPGPFPQFGGFDPSGAMRFGVGGPGGGFAVTAATGNSRTMVSSSASVTVPNGGVGAIFDSELRPFVTGVMPIVSGAPVFEDGGPVSPLAERLHRLNSGERPHSSIMRPTTQSRPKDIEESQPAGQYSSQSSATRGDLSVAEIRRRQRAEQNEKHEEILALIETAKGHEDRGSPGVAIIYLKQAARRASGEQRESLIAKIQSLEKARK